MEFPDKPFGDGSNHFDACTWIPRRGGLADRIVPELSGFAETAFPDERIAYRHAGPLYWVNSIFRRDSRISGRGSRFSRAYHPERKQRRCDDDPAVEDPKRRVHADAVRH